MRVICLSMMFVRALMVIDKQMTLMFLLLTHNWAIDTPPGSALKKTTTSFQSSFALMKGFRSKHQLLFTLLAV